MGFALQRAQLTKKLWMECKRNGLIAFNKYKIVSGFIECFVSGFLETFNGP